MDALTLSVLLAIGFSLLLSIIQIMSKTQSFMSCLTGAWFIYLLIMTVGNIMTTLAVPYIIDTIRGDTTKAATAAPQHADAIKSPQDSLQTAAVDTAQTPLQVDEKAQESELEISSFIDSVPFKGFWYAVFGVFGFGFIIRKINLAFGENDIFTLNDWINKAQDNAEAAALEKKTDLEREKASNLAHKLKELPEAELNSHVMEILGSDMPQRLQDLATQANADPRLTKALALASGDYERASSIILK